MKSAIVAVVCVCIMPSGVLLAQSRGPVAAAPAPRTLRALSLADIEPSRLLPRPSDDGSSVQMRELAAVRHLVETRTSARFEQAVWDAEHEDASLFKATIGPAFDLAALPTTARLLDVVINDQAIAVAAAKTHFSRRLPVMAAAPAQYQSWTCDKDGRRPESRAPRSYPSGHATLAYAVGGVLARLMPERAETILTRAADYAYSREVCGDHYHSDIEASQALGTALAALFVHVDVLKPQFDAARAELRAAHLTQ